MLAFSKDITIKDPTHPKEDEDSRLKDYMEYQRRLDNVKIVYYSLKFAKTRLEDEFDACRKSGKDPAEFCEVEFPFSHRFASPRILLLMLKKLISGHNTANKWFKMNAYYHVLAFDCIKKFIAHYNNLLTESPEEAAEYKISNNSLIDFNDWVFLFFPDVDFHLGKNLGYQQYPFAKRNETIEAELEKEIQKGLSQEEALKAIQNDFEIEDCSIKILLGKQIEDDDLELFHTPMKNNIYEFLTQKNEGSWDSLDGDTLQSQAWSLGAQLKVTVWKKRKRPKREEKV